MSLVLSMGKPVGIAAAILGLIQGLVWFILTLLAVLSYNCVFDSSGLTTGYQSSDAFLASLLNLYFIGPSCNITSAPVPIADVLTPEEMQIWMIINMVFNFIWMVSSIYYLVDLNQNTKPAVSTTVWVGVTCAVLTLDLATTIRFGVNYEMVQGFVNASNAPSVEGAYALTTSAFLMSMAARGYILWLVDEALVILLTVGLVKGNKASKASTRNLSRQASFVNPTMNHRYPDDDDDDDKTYHQPTARNNAWDPPTEPQTPLYPYSMSHQMSPSSVSDHNYGYSTQPRQQPTLVLQDPPKTHHTTPHQGQHGQPKHIPDPDYSPIMSRSTANMLPPVVLRKPPARIAHVGRTVF